MIVLDEQLLRFDLARHIADWYPGTVCFITELRPSTVIKDDNIPALLRSQNSPTFVTINEIDFWRKVQPDPRFCVICISLPLPRAREIPNLVRAILKREEFSTKQKRMGLVIHLSANGVIRYYNISLTTPIILSDKLT